MVQKSAAHKQAINRQKGPKPLAETPLGFPIRFPSSYRNPAFDPAAPAVPPRKTTFHRHLPRPQVQYPQRRFKKAPPPPLPRTFQLPTPGKGGVPKRKGYRVQGLQLGVMGRDGVFRSEYIPTFTDGHFDFVQDSEYLQLTAEAFQTKLPIRIVISFDSVESITVDNDAKLLLLQLLYAPSLEVYQSVSDVERCTAFDSTHRDIAPFVSQNLLLSFSSPSVLQPLLDAVSKPPIPRPLSAPIPVLHQHLAIYSQVKLLAFRASLSELNPVFAFQLEAILHDGLLFPDEFGPILDAVAEMELLYGETATERILVALRRRLSVDLFQRKRREEKLPDFDLEALIEESRQAVMEEREQLHLVADDQHFLCRHVYITPTGMKLEGPFIEQGNSIVRRYPQGIPYLLRVSFVEEDRTSLQVGRWGVLKEFLRSHVYSTLSHGVDLCGRNYEFLAYSQSSLRNHTVWMLSPFSLDDYEDVLLEEDEDGELLYPDLIDAEAVRLSLGDFKKIAHQPTLYGARLSQGFTSSRASVSLKADNILTIPDILSTGEFGVVKSNHTDGAGTMSRRLRDKAWEALAGTSHHRDFDGPPPDVFQIRLGGAKGVIILDPSLHGEKLALRPSQHKFKAYFDEETHRAFTLHIAEAFTRPGPLHLNRPLISALDDLKIKPPVFLTLQRQAIDRMLREKESIGGSIALLRRYEFGAGTRLQSLLLSLKKLENVDSVKILVDEPFLRASMDLVTSRVLREFKYSARIPHPGCYNLVGVPDQDDHLEPDEIYCAIREPGGVVRYLEGPIAITRSPTLDAGDVRVVRAVGQLPDRFPAFKIISLVNCVVLSTKGDRAIASMMGGGDLDGDQYNIITIPELIPKKTIDPRDHEGMAPHRLEKACTINDVAAFFAEFIENDNVGIAATTHLRIADISKEGGFDPRCKQLADLYSRAVDYSKTGNAVPLEDIPPLKGPRPDFLTHKDYSNKGQYESQRALGQLYRAIPNTQVDLTPTLTSTADDSTSSTFVALRSHLLHRSHNSFGFSPLELTSSLRTTTSRIRHAFCAEFSLLAEVGNFPRRPGQGLSEVEMFIGSIASESQRDRRGARNAATSLRFQVARLVDAIEELIGGDLSLGDKLSSAWACWDEALEQSESEFGVKSFRWICAALVLDYTELLEVHPPMYRDPSPEYPSRVPSTVVSTAAPSRANSRTSTPNPPSPILTRPHSPEKTISAGSAGTKGSRRKERERQARENQIELARLDALAELGREAEGGGDGAWEIGDREEKAADDGWGGGGWGADASKKLAPAPAPKSDGWSSLAPGGDRVGATIRSWADCVGGPPRQPTSKRGGADARASIRPHPLPPPSPNDFPALASEPAPRRSRITSKQKPIFSSSSSSNTKIKVVPPPAPTSLADRFSTSAFPTTLPPARATSSSTSSSTSTVIFPVEDRSVVSSSTTSTVTQSEPSGWDSPPSVPLVATGWGDEEADGGGHGSGWEIKEAPSNQSTSGGWGAEWD